MRGRQEGQPAAGPVAALPAQAGHHPGGVAVHAPARQEPRRGHRQVQRRGGAGRAEGPSLRGTNLLVVIIFRG